MERIVFLIVCALCCASFFIAQALHWGNGRRNKGSRGQSANPSAGIKNASGSSNLQAQLEESKKRIRESSK